jgi:pimeloyl-ACP methyl ester carboxylesterase
MLSDSDFRAPTTLAGNVTWASLGLVCTPPDRARDVFAALMLALIDGARRDANLAARPSSPHRIGPRVMDERFTKVGGQPLRYLVCGQGKPLVLCHGFLSSAEEFGGRFSELGAHRTLIIPDLPGNGASPPLPGRHTSGAMADLVFDLLTQLEIDRFDVGGLCLGATVACALAERAGDRAERLVLHTPLLSPNLMRRRYLEQVRLLSRRPMWDAVVWLSRQRWISDLYKRFVIVEGDVDDRTADVNYENQRRADPRAAREWLNDCLRRDDVDVVAARAKATLIIVAKHDRLVDVERLKGLIARLPDLHVFTDSDQGHGWNEAAVHRQLEVLKEFFNGGGNGANGSGAHKGTIAHNGSSAHNGRNGGSAPNGSTGLPVSVVPRLRDTVEVTLAPN